MTDRTRRLRWFVAPLGAMVCVLALTGPVAGAAATPQPRALTAHTWRLQSNSALTLSFTATTISYPEGCSGGAYRVRFADGAFTVGRPVGVHFSCGGSPSAAGLRIDRVLGGTVHWSVRGSRLTLTRSGAGTLAYRVTKTITLTNTHWYLQQVDRPNAPNLIEQGGDLVVHGSTLRARDGDGCDTLTADVTTTASTIASRHVHRGNPHCFESAALATAFTGRHHYRISFGELYVDAGRGEAIYDDAARHGYDVNPVPTRRPASSYPATAAAVVNTTWTLTAMREQTRTIAKLPTARLQIAHSELTINGTGTTGHARLRTWTDAFLSGTPRAVHRATGSAATAADPVLADLLSGEVAFWQVRGSTLTVDDGFGVVLTFRAAV